MNANTETLKDIKLLDSINEILGGRFPERFVHAVYNHMKANTEDAYDHQYLRDSLHVANFLMRRTAEFDEHERNMAYAVIMLIEIGHPITSHYPYEASPGTAWYFLRMYANGMFNKEEERFITQSCKPLKPTTVRLNSYTKIQSVVYNTQKVTDIVSQNYQKIYNTFVDSHNKLMGRKELNDLFWSTYGPQGNIWEAISDSAKGIFASEIALFKREVGSVIEEHTD
ncbi:hypothetical protein D3C81_288120 [compost metagenome]